MGFINPAVKHLSLGFWQRNWNSPCYVSSNVPIYQSITNPVLNIFFYVLLQVLIFFKPTSQVVYEICKFEKIVLCLFFHGRIFAYGTSWIFYLSCYSSALFTKIRILVFSLAIRTGSNYISVRQEFLVKFTIKLDYFLFIDVIIF